MGRGLGDDGVKFGTLTRGLVWRGLGDDGVKFGTLSRGLVGRGLGDDGVKFWTLTRGLVGRGLGDDGVHSRGIEPWQCEDSPGHHSTLCTATLFINRFNLSS